MNNKGMTTIELLVCFVLISIVSVSLFNTISSFNNKREVESVKSDVLTYKNNIAKLIEDDLIHHGLSVVNINDEENYKYTVDMDFRDGVKRRLVIMSYDGNIHGNGSSYYIAYGEPDSLIKYTLPDEGSYSYEDPNLETPPDDDSKTVNVKDLTFNSITVEGDQNCLHVHVGFYHPDLGNKYSINIVAPINYIS